MPGRAPFTCPRCQRQVWLTIPAPVNVTSAGVQIINVSGLTKALTLHTFTGCAG